MRRHPPPAQDPAPPPRSDGRAALWLLALLLPALGAWAWSLRLDDGVHRPGALRAFQAGSQDHALLVFAGALHLLDGQGRRLARQPVTDLGLAGEPLDVDVTQAANGRLHAWLLADEPPRLVRCAIEVPAMRLQACAAVLTGPQLKLEARSFAMHLAVDAARERVYLADARGHAVRAFAFDGRLLAASAPGELLFPNRLQLDGDRLVVADNDHRRLAWLDAAGDRPTLRLQRSLPLAAHPAGAGRKAADFALPAAGAPLCVLAVQQGQQHGRLVAYGDGLAPRGSADLGPWRDPLVIERMGADLLVADFEGIALLRVGAGGALQGAFGDAALQAEFRAAREQRFAARLWRQGALAAMGLIVVIGGWLAWRQRRAGAQAAPAHDARPQVAPAVAPQPLTLLTEAWYRRRMLRLLGLPPALLAVGLGGALLLGGAHLPGLLLAQLLGSLLVVAALALLAARVIADRRLVIQQGRVELRFGQRPLASAAFGELLASPSQLVVGEALVPYREAADGGRWIYPRESLEPYLLAHLGPGQWRADGQLGGYPGDERVSVVRVVAVVVVAGLLLGAFVWLGGR